jgi:hypothetical protein
MPEFEVQFPQATEILVEPFDARVHILPVGVLTDDELQRIQQFLSVVIEPIQQADFGYGSFMDRHTAVRTFWQGVEYSRPIFTD